MKLLCRILYNFFGYRNSPKILEKVYKLFSKTYTDHFAWSKWVHVHVHFH